MTVLGYCIGGALATCFAALHPEVTRNLVLLTAPLDFSDAGQFGRMTARGIFPIDQLTDTFPTVPGQMPDIGTKLLNPVASYVGTYLQLWEKLGVELRPFRLAGDVSLGERQRPVRRGGIPPVDRRVLPGQPAGSGHARDGWPAGPPVRHPLPGPQYRREPRSDRATRRPPSSSRTASAARTRRSSWSMVVMSGSSSAGRPARTCGRRSAPGSAHTTDRAGRASTRRKVKVIRRASRYAG